MWGNEVLYPTDLNAEIDNIITNAASLISPLTGALDWDGYAHTLDTAGVTTAQSTASIAWSFTPGSKSGSPGTTGSISNWAANTYTDSNTAGSGTVAAWTGHSFQRPTLAASNASVTTTDAATVYIAGSPITGSNETLTNSWSLWIDSGAVRFDGTVTCNDTVSGTPKVQLTCAGGLWGLTLTNGTDATNDIDIAVGECVSDDTTASDRVRMAVTSALTKQLDAAWAVGSAAGGRDTGSIANGTWHVWIIMRPDTGVVDALFSTSATSPTMPANYTKKRRIGAILRESAAIVAFVQSGDSFMRGTPVLDISANNPGTSAVTRTLSVPTGVNVFALVNVGLDVVSPGGALYLSDLSQADLAPALTTAPLGNIGRDFSTGNLNQVSGPFSIRTNTSAQIRSRVSASDATTDVYIATTGWIDSRGRLN